MRTGDFIPAHGTTRRLFQPVRDRLDEYLAESPSLSVQLCVYHRGELVIDLVGGAALEHDAMTGVYSVSKAASAFVIARLLDQGLLGLDQRVIEFWPEFAAEGKGDVTVRQLLSHQAGLVGVDGGLAIGDVTHSATGAEKLAAQRPHWRPGTAFGYHALTIGILMEEIVRRLTGQSLQGIFESQIRQPRDIDFYLGLPSQADSRYVPIEEAILTPDQQRDAASRAPQDSLAEMAFANVHAPDGLGVDGMSTNNPAIRRSGPAAIGGVASAAGLAKLFSFALRSDQTQIASAQILASMSQQCSWGVDRVLNVTNAFGTVFLLPQPRMPYGSHHAFGHDGAAGALAFADPATEISFGYVPFPTQYPGGADLRAVELARVVAQCVRR